ncbi:MAG: GNAT family N-acetyltransferase [Methylocystis sp.]|nr:MAG: GNAT family N-acetyltransferase [Methylocystis sp.]
MNYIEPSREPLPGLGASPRLRRRAQGDIPEMLDLWVASWGAVYPDIDFNARRDWLIEQITALETGGAVTLCVLAKESQALAGFVVINPDSGWLDQICVGLPYKGDGCAEILMAAACAVSPGVVRLDVNADNMRAIRFYERFGFAQTGRGENTLSGRATIQMEWRAPE